MNLPPEQEAIRAKCFHPSGTFVKFPMEEVETSIPARFEKIVRMYPERLAVRAGGHSVTYEALNQAANRIAHAILAQRGEGEEPVALLLDHDADFIAAILAVLKTGKIYIPLDPSHPPARTNYIFEDTQASLIVTNNENSSSARNLARNRCQLLNIDRVDSSVMTENIGLSLPPGTLAYILYTSGSTGQPKGVFHNHRNVLHRVKSDTNVFHLCTDDHLSLLSSCTSNASVGDIFGALLNGATLCPFRLKDEGLVKVADWLIREGITIYHSVPTVFRHVCGALTGAKQFPMLRLVCLGGEPVYKREVEFYRKHFAAPCAFLNLLGITETHNLTAYVIDKNTRTEGSRMPAGYPFEDKEVLLLDDNREAVAPGHVGEIAIRSRYLSLGYWRKPQLTLAKFLPDPKGGDQRIYLTGDLGRMAPDGCLLHLGRKDFQVKVRGYKVEVSETEMALLDHAAIKEAAVVGREIQFGGRRLVAYFVPTRQPAPTVTELRNFLKDRVPDYMVPSHFVMLDSLPLTPNGKVDRNALQPPGRQRPQLDVDYVPAGTPTEALLVDIWADILKVEKVGIHDNFFDLGGDSLGATSVISRVIKEFQFELPLQSLFESPCIADMAAVIAAYQGRTLDEQGLTTLLDELKSLSDEDAEQFLGKQPHDNFKA